MIETLATHSHALRAVFAKAGEYYTHSLCVVQGDDCLPLLHAASGSPIFQELHQQGDTPTDAIAFLTGMADHRYWSASVSPCPANAAELLIDLASRTKQPPTPFATHYTLAPGVDAAARDGAIHLHTAGAPACVLTPTQRDNAASCRLSLGDRLVEVTPVECLDSVQWGLRLSLADC